MDNNLSQRSPPDTASKDKPAEPVSQLIIAEDYVEPMAEVSIKFDESIAVMIPNSAIGQL